MEGEPRAGVAGCAGAVDRLARNLCWPTCREASQRRNWVDLTQSLLTHIRSACAAGPFSDESEFHLALAAQLGECSIKVQASFAAPAIASRRPSQADIDECNRKGRVLPPEGKDPCEGRRRAIDVLWHGPDSPVAIELKFRADWRSDVYGYEFLKDLHRLERLRHVLVRSQIVEPDVERYAIFLTTVGDYWAAGASREPKTFRISDGRSIPAGYWVQYEQPSAATRWHDYIPFHLANPYTFVWHDLGRCGRVLIVPVVPQGSVGAPGG